MKDVIRVYFGKKRRLIQKYKKILVTGIVLLFFSVILYYAVPQIVMKRPHIDEITPSTVMAGSTFNAGNIISLYGSNFNHILGVYINDEWEPDCTISYADSGLLMLALPKYYYSDENELNLQLQIRINSDLTAMSNKVKFTVLSDKDIAVPEIIETDAEILKYDGNLIKTVELTGKNFTEDSVVFINNVAVNTEYNNGKLVAQVPFSEFCTSDQAILKIVQYYNGYPTSIESRSYYIESESIDDEIMPVNEQLTLYYLQAMEKENYIVLMAVKDEASMAVTSNILQKMSEMGLKKSLEGKMQYSYIAVLDGKENIYENLSTDELFWDMILEGHKIHIESAGYNVGNNSVIEIDGTDYSVNGRGLNIVIFDKKSQTVADSVCIDFYEGLVISR